MGNSKIVKPVAWAVGLVLLVVVGYASWPREDYTTKVVMTSAQNLAVGAPVWINGFEAGAVMDIEARDGKAIVTVGIAPEHAPLHAGTTSRVHWYAALGERVVTLYPGPATNPEIPDGGLLDAPSQQVEVDQVLAALDQPTRDKLDGLIRSINATTAGKEKDVQATIRAAGPTVEAAGAIFEAVGRDGPAIRQLVTQLQEMIEVTAKQQNDVRGSISSLDRFSTNVATTQRQLSDSLHELPPTLREANATLKAVPPAVEPTNALLDDLRPGTAKLPGLADDLAPLMRDMRPAIHDLRPTVEHLRDLLDLTPDLMDNANHVFPQVSAFLDGYQPAVSYLRPFVPETVGWVQNWGKNFGAYDSQGHLWSAILGEAGPQGVDESPVTLPPLERTPERKPGDVVGQPWDDPDKPKTDANGSPIQ